MGDHLEIELKWALDAAGWRAAAHRLDRMLGAPAKLAQENRFYDAADLRLRRAGMNLRLRRENGRILVTGKRKAPAQAGAQVHVEWEQPAAAGLWPDDPRLPPPTALLVIPDWLDAALAGAPLVGLGGFANQRLAWHHGTELLCLDRTDFAAGTVDHELEIETSDPAATAAAWRQRLADWGIAWQPQPLSKFARFLARATPQGAIR
jgi:inorganic triphosphatase YgiF